MTYLIHKLFMVKSNPSGAEPVPKNALMNETMNHTISIKPDTTYLFRVINMGAFAGQYLWFEDHTMRIVEVDGIYTKEAEADMIYISAAQRVSFLLTTKKSTSKNFPIVASMDTVSDQNTLHSMRREILIIHSRLSLTSSPMTSTTTPPAGSSTMTPRTSLRPPPWTA